MTGSALAQNPEVSPPRYTGVTEVDFSYAPDSTLHLGSVDTGDLNTMRSRVRYTGTFISEGPVAWSVGFEYERYSFGIPGGQPLPNSVGSVSLPLGVRWKLNDRWMFLGEVSPGIYSDFNDLNGPDFNAPILAGVAYSVNDRLQIFFQLSIDARRDVPIVGGPGVRWQINDAWALSLLLPRPRVEFRLNENWLFYGGAELAGGAYQLANDAGTKRNDPRLDNVNLVYREVRAGLGAQWNLGRGFRLEVAGGWLIDRRFVVDERDLQWNGDGGIYGRAQISYRY
jgi:hypothetical protein